MTGATGPTGATGSTGAAGPAGPVSNRTEADSLSAGTTASPLVLTADDNRVTTCGSTPTVQLTFNSIGRTQTVRNRCTVSLTVLPQSGGAFETSTGVYGTANAGITIAAGNNAVFEPASSTQWDY